MDKIIIPEYIKEFINKSKDNRGHLNFKKMKVNMTDDVKNWFENINKEINEFEITAEVVNYILKNNISTLNHCLTCGKIIDYEHNYCSVKCSKSNADIKEKIKKTCLEKYGVENPSQSDIIKKKKEETYFKHYGVKYFSQTNEFKQKCIDKSREKYGTDYPTQANEVKEKSKKTCLEKYGCEYSLQSKEVREKCKETMLEKYSVDNYNQSEDFKEKYKNTCLKKYGVEHYSKTDEFKKKVTETTNERYGTDYYTQTDEYKEKYKKTCEEKYGCGIINSFQSEEIKEKIKKTNLEKYGVDVASKSDIVKNKIKQTNLEKYGVTCNLSDEKTKEKIKKTNLEKYGYEIATKNKEVIKKSIKTQRNNYYDKFIKLLANKNISLEMEKKEYINADTLKYKCLKCNNIFEIDRTNPQTIYCPYCHKQPYSKKEKEVVEWIQSIYSGNIIENDREILNGKELDIYIPDKKLAIEFDGNYWHSAKIKEKEYHQEKTLACIEKGIKLIHIFEYDWDFNQEIIKSIVKSAFGIYDKRIYARKCIAKEISTDDYKNFLDINHLQCSINSSIRYGLYHQNELVSVIGFGKSRFKKDEIELHRFCCKLNYHIPGAFSKLIKHSGIDNFITYVDLAHFTGDGYKKIGFKELSVTEPNYKWISDDGTIVLNRFQTQKHKLAKLLKNYDKNLTEAENMELNCYFRIFDSGNLKLKY